VATAYKRSKKALEKLRTILARPALFIHYSCESFYDHSSPASRRVTSIAVRIGNSSQTHSFSLHLSAEKLGCLSTINAHLDQCEKAMLKDYYAFVRTRQHGYTWLHWNMRDANYGFEAIDHRFSVLGGKPVQIADADKTDLSPLLIDIYGKSYTGHPRLIWLIQKNHIHDRAILTGEQEAEAFVQGHFVALHQSTLQKAQALGDIADLAARKQLRTQRKWREIYGASLADFGDALKDNWIWVLGTTLLAIALGAAPFLIGN
jgi:hypothetical protein